MTPVCGAGAQPLAVSMGDPAGIGPDVILAAYARREDAKLPPFIVIGDRDMLADRAAALGLSVALEATPPEEASACFGAALPVFHTPLMRPAVAGTPDSGNAAAIIGAIETAVDWTLTGRTSAVVTAPIAKSVLYAAGFGFPGHTEFLADLAEKATGTSVLPVMMIAGPKLKVVPVTIHIALAEVPRQLTSELIVETTRVTALGLADGFGISRPRLAIAGLNPHAGEQGTMGSEDEDIVRPAVERLRAMGFDVVGPLPADTMFHDRARATYDAAICMYHDQALIPAKALGFDDGVNVTLGLPFIRTSPDHGTAFALAGTGQARPDSMIAALSLAGDMAASKRSA